MLPGTYNTERRGRAREAEWAVVDGAEIDGVEENEEAEVVEDASVRLAGRERFARVRNINMYPLLSLFSNTKSIF